MGTTDPRGTGRALVEATLEHSGVKGMRWGVRKDRSGGSYSGPSKRNTYSIRKGKKVTGLSRRDGAHVDSNERKIRDLTRLRDGKGPFNKVLATAGKLFMGKAKRTKRFDIEIRELRNQNERILAGEASIRDRRDRFASINLTEVTISIRPKKT